VKNKLATVLGTDRLENRWEEGLEASKKEGILKLPSSEAGMMNILWTNPH
jgi:hypothetical protein